jgi:N-acetyl-1-D-myo-inositol-2-amino-2-deoxy-alpha-D-glucopyranoside deacetylase
MGAVEAAADPAYRPDLGDPWAVAKVYWCCVPRSVLQQGIDAMAAAGDDSFFEGVTDADDLPFAVPDDEVTAAVDGRAFVAQKDAAMRAHPTQIMVDGPFFALSNNLGQEVLAVEYYRLVKGERGPAGDAANGWEVDLFAGLSG